MDEPPFDDIRKRIRFSYAGSVPLARECFGPCAKQIVNGLEPQGYSEEIDDMLIPSVLVSTGVKSGPQATWGLPIFYTVTCFIGTGIAGWVVKKLCDTAYDKVILPAIKSMGLRFAEKREEELNLEIRVFFETDQLLVRVAARCESPESYSLVERLVPIALQNASDFIGRNGATGRMYTYNIINGQLSGIPAISQEMLSPGHLWKD